MARGKHQTKAARIREWAAAHPNASHPEIIAGLKAEGVEVAAGNIVSALKANGHAKQSPPVATNGQHLEEMPPELSGVLEAQKLAFKLGGVDRAKIALQKLETVLAIKA
jgi:hypothetical protein